MRKTKKADAVAMGAPSLSKTADEADERERLRQEEALDEALKNTFPASDPVSVEQP